MLFIIHLINLRDNKIAGGKFSKSALMDLIFAHKKVGRTIFLKPGGDEETIG